MRIIIDQDKCIGCGTCETMCPDVFKLDLKSYKASVILENGSEKCASDAVVKSCPTSAIQIENDAH